MGDFLAALRSRLLIVDGAMGTSVQDRAPTEADFGGLDGCNEVLVRTRPDLVRDIHLSFLAVGCDAVETDTFGGAPWVLDEYGLADETETLSEAAARVAREAVAQTGGAERFVLGSVGPGTRSPTLALGKDPSAADFIDYDGAVAGYTRQCRGLLAGGVDAVIVETVFDLLQCKAAVWAAKEAMELEGRRVPIVVTVTIEKDLNTMLLGTEIGAALTAIDPLGVDVIGLNCATGPEDMREHVRHLSAHARAPICVIPNAGIPHMDEGRTVYPLSPEGLAEAHREFVEDLGVSMIGGCCGTTPAHLEAVVRRCRDLKPAPRTPVWEPSLASLYQAMPIRQDTSFLVVGERLNANGSRAFRDLLADGDVERMAEVARAQTREGAHALDVCVDYVGRDGAADVAALVDRLATTSTLPLVVDSTEVDVMAAALRRLGGRPLLNSVNLEDGRERADRVLALARQFGAAVVALAIDERGQARDADWKVEVCERIARIAVDEHGMEASDLVFDTLTFPLSSGQEELRRDGLATLDAIERVKAAVPGCSTILGVSNVSFGLEPAARQALNSVFLAMAMQRGLDAAIVNPARILPLDRIDERARQLCEDLILDRRTADHDPLAELMAHFSGATTDQGADDEAFAALELTERLERRIVDARREGLEADLDEAMRSGLAPLDIVNSHLLAGMKVVGDLFGAGRMQLPFVLQSAECMKAAVGHLEPHMESAQESGKARIVLATVKGDVHDIGKNLVDIILSNNGYSVRNIGIKQPVDAIVAAAEDFGADAIGLSGLLVKSTVVMRDDLLELGRRGLQHYPVLLGGAALTRTYVEQDLRAVYDGPLFYCRDAFAGLHRMDEVARVKEAGTAAAAGLEDSWGRQVAQPRVRATGRAKQRVDEPTDVRVATDVGSAGAALLGLTRRAGAAARADRRAAEPHRAVPQPVGVRPGCTGRRGRAAGHARDGACGAAAGPGGRVRLLGLRQRRGRRGPVRSARQRSGRRALQLPAPVAGAPAVHRRLLPTRHRTRPHGRPDIRP